MGVSKLVQAKQFQNKQLQAKQFQAKRFYAKRLQAKLLQAPWFPALPRATTRNLWLLLAGALATQNIAVFHSSQTANTTVLALLVWGGALVCLEDRLDQLQPRPSRSARWLGSALVVWVLLRTALVLQWDGLLYALAPIGGLALALVARPWRQLGLFREALLCLLLLPGFALLMRLLPEEPISLLTASLVGLFLNSLGMGVVVDQRSVLMAPGRGVQVLAACNGLDMISLVFCTAIIFLLAFPIRSKLSRLIVLIAAPLIGLLSNTIRIAILTLIAGSGNGKGSFWFDFFHQQTASLVFSGLAVFLIGLCYLRLLEPELAPLPQGPPSDRPRAPYPHGPETPFQGQPCLELGQAQHQDLRNRMEIKP